jgi:hypothetical protein
LTLVLAFGKMKSCYAMANQVQSNEVTCQGQKKKGKPSKYNQIYVTHTQKKKRKKREEEEVVEISPKVLIKIIIISP